MRELKFRAWDKQEKQMMKVSAISLENKEIGVKDFRTYHFFRIKNIELMQYIGLKDKNGTEIYEGCELDGRYVVEYIAPKFVCKDLVNGDIIDLYENKFTITKEHCKIPQDSEGSIN